MTDASFTATGITPDRYNASNANVFMGQGIRFTTGLKVSF
jgi:hypothetical protein